MTDNPDIKQTPSPLDNPQHLGDGAYVSTNPTTGGIVFTANHHDPVFASDTVWLDQYALRALRRYLEERDKRLNRPRVKATLARLSACECGFPALSEDIPMGTEFTVDPSDQGSFTLICGGCGKFNQVVGIFVYKRQPHGRDGYLPRSIFDIDKTGD